MGADRDKSRFEAVTPLAGLRIIELVDARPTLSRPGYLISTFRRTHPCLGSRSGPGGLISARRSIRVEPLSPSSAGSRLDLQVFRRPDHRPPHMRDRAVVEPEALFRLTEIAADNISELLELDMHVGIERI